MDLILGTLLSYIGPYVASFSTLGTVVTWLMRLAWTRRFPSLRWVALLAVPLLVTHFYVQPVYVEYTKHALEQGRIVRDANKGCRRTMFESTHFTRACNEGEEKVSTSAFAAAHDKVVNNFSASVRETFASGWTTISMVLVAAGVLVTALGIGAKRYEQYGVRRYGKARLDNLAERAAHIPTPPMCEPEDY